MRKTWLQAIQKSWSLKLHDFLPIAVFLILGGFGIFHHEMWRDEIQAWLLVRDSSSLTDFYENFKYEGHPILWYFCLFLIKSFTKSLVTIQIFNWLIVTGIVYLFVKYSPFTKLQKLLFCFSYYPLYEYGLIARNYAMGILFLFLFCILYQFRNYQILSLSVCLAFLANSSTFAFILSAVFGLLVAFDLISSYGLKPLFDKHRWQLPISGFIILSGWILAGVPIFWSALQAWSGIGDVVERGTAFSGVSTINQANDSGPAWLKIGRDLSRTWNYIWESYVPIPNIKVDFWNSNIFDSISVFFRTWGIENWQIGGFVTLIASTILFFLCLRLFIAKRLILAAYCLGSFAIAFLCFLYPSQLRHYGHLFFLFLGCVWISKYAISQTPLLGISGLSQTFEKNFITSLLIAQAIAGAFAYTVDIIYPFSTSRDVAEFIQAQGLSSLPVVGYEKRPTTTLSGYLNKPLYNPGSDQFESFWTTRSPEVETEDILMDAIRLAQRQNSAVLIVVTEAIDTSAFPTVHKLKSFNGPRIVRSEGFHLYQVEAP